MKLNMTCETCEFGSNKSCCTENSKKNYQNDTECGDWGASLEYFSEIMDNAPWYIIEPYRRCHIGYDKFLDLLRKDDQGIGIEINIYDAIEKVYEVTPWELAGVLGVSIGVLGYARTRKTIDKRKRQFSSRLHIPESFFDRFLSTQLETLKQCREEFYEFYGSETIKKFKQNGIDAMHLKFVEDAAHDKFLNERYREEYQYKYQYEEKNKMYHDLSDDYKSRDYVIAITLKEGEYYGNLFYEYNYGGYGLSVSIMRDILDFVENLDCEEIDALNEEGLLNNNIGLKSDMNGKKIYFELKNERGDVLKKIISEDELQKYIVGYEMIRCDGHGMKKERRRCSSCQNFKPIEGCTKGNCIARGDIVQRSRIICAFDYIPNKNECCNGETFYNS